MLFNVPEDFEQLEVAVIERINLSVHYPPSARNEIPITAEYRLY